MIDGRREKLRTSDLITDRICIQFNATVCAGKFLGQALLMLTPRHVHLFQPLNISVVQCPAVKRSVAHTQNYTYILSLMEYYFSTDDLALNLCALSTLTWLSSVVAQLLTDEATLTLSSIKGINERYQVSANCRYRDGNVDAYELSRCHGHGGLALRLSPHN